MPLIEKDQEELMQRRLEEKIQTNVEAKLFRYYRNVGSLIITVLGLVGISIGWPALQTQIASTIEKQIFEQVKKPVEDAQKAAIGAEDLANTAHRTVETGLEVIRDKQARITKTLGKLDARSDDLNATFARVYAQIDQLKKDAEDLQQKIDTYDEQYKFNLVTQDDIKTINRDLSSLAQKSRDLAGAVQRIEGDSGSANGKILVSSFNKVATNAKERSETLTPTKSTVYVQFAGGRREDIKAVSEKLKAQEWLVPGEERTPKAAGFKEVRYFHTQDAKAAEELTADINTALDEVGFGNITVKTIDSTKYPKPPRKGVLELWVEIPLR